MPFNETFNKSGDTFIDNSSKLSKILESIPPAETTKIAVVRPTTRFEIVTGDNPDMKRTLEKQDHYIDSELQQITTPMSLKEREEKISELKCQFQASLSKAAEEEQKHFLKMVKKHGIQVREILEDKGHLETGEFAYYTDQIFATDTGQYYDNDGKLSFIPGNFKNKQRQGEERLARQQAENFGAVIQPLFSKEGQALTFEGGDIRQMPGKKLFFIGQGHRSDADTSKAVAEIAGYYVLPVKLLQEQFYHLDCCFLPLPQDAAVIYEGEYEIKDGKEVTDSNGWPKIISGTETMDEVSRELIRTLYRNDKLILINKNEALAFATNAALLQSSTEHRFKLFVNGDRSKPFNDEQEAINSHQVSFTNEHIQQIMHATENTMDIVEVPYSTMHGSGGSVRCTVQEVACTQENLYPLKVNKYHCGDMADKIEIRRSKYQGEQLFFAKNSEDRSSVQEEPDLQSSNFPPSTRRGTL